MTEIKSADESATGSIEIIRTPYGLRVPLTVREAWIGCILPCYPYLGRGNELGVFASEKIPRNRYIFIVPQDLAIAALRVRRQWAANWWNRRGFPQDGQSFCFDEREARILQGVNYPKLTLVTEEMRGCPNR